MNGPVQLKPSRSGTELPRRRLLGSFDPVLMGWTSRAAILGPYQTVVTTNGVLRPIALVGGRAVATCTMSAGRVTLARPSRPALLRT
ncbi:MAG: DNA glycosylase AlkZ-like family protein [Acidimicrobiales bacterium]